MELIIPSIRIRIPKLASLARLTGLATVAVALALCAQRDGAQSAGTPTNAVPDAAGGQHTSLELDANGHPVVSYFAATDLKVLHCGNATCTAANSVTSPDTGGVVGQFTSLALDAAGFPVISYLDNTNFDLKVMHCNDVNCAGGGESITSPDAADAVGEFTSLALDAAGQPVITYFDTTNDRLKVMHCNDVNCAGASESIISPDSAIGAGLYTSVAVDASGFPVISYYDMTNGNLKVSHCNSPSCLSANISAPDTAGTVGEYTSLALDAAGRPVISYYDRTNGDLKVMHCNDANCAGGGESITSPHTLGNVGEHTSLALDAAGFPVVSYYDATNTDLWVMHCNDVNCAPGGETFFTVTSGAFALGQFSSLALDTFGRPAVSFYNETNVDLQVLHCGTPSCNHNPGVQEIRIASLTAGWPSAPIGGACYSVDPVVGLPAFVVCDNNSGPALGFSDACLKDGSLACTDDDTAVGSISVAVNTALYNVTAASAPGHAVASHVKFCDPAAGVDAKCTFTHTPLTRPWFPWDLNGDGSVSAPDIFQEIDHFNETKPTP